MVIGYRLLSALQAGCEVNTFGLLSPSAAQNCLRKSPDRALSDLESSVMLCSLALALAVNQASLQAHSHSIDVATSLHYSSARRTKGETFFTTRMDTKLELLGYSIPFCYMLERLHAHCSPLRYIVAVQCCCTQAGNQFCLCVLPRY